MFDFTPATSGDYKLSVDSDGDSLLAIREQGSGVVLQADDDHTGEGANDFDPVIGSVTLSSGVTYEVVVGQYPESSRVVSQGSIFAELNGGTDGQFVIGSLTGLDVKISDNFGAVTAALVTLFYLRYCKTQAALKFQASA